LIFAAACQTGITSVSQDNASELIGMLRPLTLYKNKNVILSLWQVDDTATTFFVEVFYSELKKQKNYTKAFLAARKRTKEEYPRPFYWAAFYLSTNI